MSFQESISHIMLQYHKTWACCNMYATATSSPMVLHMPYELLISICAKYKKKHITTKCFVCNNSTCNILWWYANCDFFWNWERCSRHHHAAQMGNGGRKWHGIKYQMAVKLLGVFKHISGHKNWQTTLQMDTYIAWYIIR